MRRFATRLVARFAAAAAALAAGPALASICHSFVEGIPGARYAQLGPIEVARAETVNIAYVAHSTYRITTPAGIVILTDYFGANGGALPDIVTMNHAHETHYTDFPDPAITHVLRGWNPLGDGPAAHNLEVEDVIVRNVTTDIRGWGEREPDGNSIFVFEVAGLCIGHLGHLHHTLGDLHHSQIGRLDVVMAPVDGTYTLNTQDMIGLMKRFKARVVLPMHAFGPGSLKIFVDGMADEFAIRRLETPDLDISLDTLPGTPTVVLTANNQPYGSFD
ncbi:MAG: MBL fold metallo-hydrolase [Pseudomonadota bacterium]